MEKSVLREMLKKTAVSLDHAISAFDGGDERALDDNVWKAAFYLEYLTFLLSLSRSNEDDAWKDREKTDRAIDLKRTLLAVRDSLKEVWGVDSIEKVYQKTWIARGQILGVQRRLDKIKADKAKK